MSKIKKANLMIGPLNLSSKFSVLELIDGLDLLNVGPTHVLNPIAAPYYYGGMQYKSNLKFLLTELDPC